MVTSRRKDVPKSRRKDAPTSRRKDVPTSRRKDVPTSRREGDSGVLNPHNVTTLGTAGALFISFLVWFCTSFEHTTLMCLKYKYVVKIDRSTLKFLE